VACEFREGIVVSDEWLFTHLLVPNIRDRFQHDLQFCKVFGRALLWGAFDENARTGIRIGTSIKERFLQDITVENEDVNAIGFNPIEKIPLHIVKGGDGELVIVLKIRRTNNNNNNNNAPITNNNTTTQTPQTPAVTPFVAERAGGNNHDEFMSPNMLHYQANVHMVLSVVHSLHQNMNNRFDEIGATVNTNQQFNKQMFRTMNNNIRRYGGTIASACAHQQRQQQGTPSSQQQQMLYGLYGTSNPKATLVNQPRDLYQLWQEWMEGINCRKPAKDFTTAERNNRKNNIKQKFY
jgi:hypothetical protein